VRGASSVNEGAPEMKGSPESATTKMFSNKLYTEDVIVDHVQLDVVSCIDVSLEHIVLLKVLGSKVRGILN
jgi:hypothetical protein